MAIKNISELNNELNNILAFANIVNKDKLSKTLEDVTEIKDKIIDKDWYIQEINNVLQEVYESIEASQLSEEELKETLSKFK